MRQKLTLRTRHKAISPKSNTASDSENQPRDRLYFILMTFRPFADGRSLDANVALYYNNIRVALDIATALVKR